MKVLVTGGAGFVGSTVVSAMAAHGHEVYVVDDLSSGKLPNLEEVRRTARITFHRFDICSEQIADLMDQVRPEVVCNLAAQPGVPASVADPIHDANVNVIGLLRVLGACVGAGVRKVVHASSGGTIYGAQRKLPITERATGRPESPYGITKRSGEDYLRFFAKEHGLEFTSLALANVYGPKQDAHGESGVVAIFATHLAAGRQPRIDGTGDQTRDFVYVDDVADAFVKAADAASGETVNIGTGVETSINEIYAHLADAAGMAHEPERGPARPGDLMRNALDPSKAAKVLGWQPWTSLADGLRATYEWFASHRD